MAAEPERRAAAGHGFTIALRGYKPTEVDQLVAELQARVDNLVAERDSLSEQKTVLASRLLSAIRRTNELGTQVKHLSASANSTDGLSQRIRVILELASSEANAMTAYAQEQLEQIKTSQAELDQRRAQLDVEQNHVLESARSEADKLRQQAIHAARAHRAEAEAESERLLSEATTMAAAVVRRAHSVASAGVDRLREHLLGELPRSLNAVIHDAVGQLPGPTEASIADDPAKAVVLPRQRQPQTDPQTEPAFDSAG